jgi:hypothetical protein
MSIKTLRCNVISQSRQDYFTFDIFSRELVEQRRIEVSMHPNVKEDNTLEKGTGQILELINCVQ